MASFDCWLLLRIKVAFLQWCWRCFENSWASSIPAVLQLTPHFLAPLKHRACCLLRTQALVFLTGVIFLGYLRCSSFLSKKGGSFSKEFVLLPHFWEPLCLSFVKVMLWIWLRIPRLEVVLGSFGGDIVTVISSWKLLVSGSQRKRWCSCNRNKNGSKGS